MSNSAETLRAWVAALVNDRKQLEGWQCEFLGVVTLLIDDIDQVTDIGEGLVAA